MAHACVYGFFFGSVCKYSWDEFMRKVCNGVKRINVIGSRCYDSISACAGLDGRNFIMSNFFRVAKTDLLLFPW